MKISALPLVLAAAVTAGCAAAPSAAPRDEPPLPVSLAQPNTADLAAAIEAGGVVRAKTTAQVASRVMATVVDVRVRAGDKVRRGDVLASLDARDLLADRTRAAAASLAADASVKAAEADVRAGDAAVQLAVALHDRIAKLHSTRSATAQELDQAVAALSAAEAQRAAATARVAAATAARDAAAAGADAAAIAATYATVAAPFDGIVVDRRIDPGSMAAPGAPLFTIEDPSVYRLELQVDEAHVRGVAVGGAVETRLDTAQVSPGEWTAGRIVEIARLDPTSHSFLVKIDLPPGVAPRSGLFGRARIAGGPHRALTIPASAVVKRGQLTFAYVVDADSRAHLRPISIASATSDRVEVLAGVTARNLVVADPPAALADGVRVTGARR